LIYGKKNDRYVSPTYRSNAIMYGDEKVREAPQSTFQTMKDTFMGSPNIRSQKEKMLYHGCKSTNQFAPFANTFHKDVAGNVNYKNYS
jgi:hypothetical protein